MNSQQGEDSDGNAQTELLRDVDLMCDRFEAALCEGLHPLIEKYVEDAVEPIRSRLLRELVALEVSYRRLGGQSPARAEYETRFPNDTAAVREEFDSGAPHTSVPAQVPTEGLAGADTPSAYLEVRCPSCHAPMEVAVDTALTDLTCDNCGSHFSLVDQTQSTQMAPPLSELGRFELIERLGVGGFGSVWKARDKELDRTVSIKIPRQGSMTAEEQERFFHEARAVAQLRHPNIVSIHEVGRDGDSVYIVSEFVRGVTLDDWLSGQQLTSREAAQLCARIADALDHAHEAGIVHRDLKPANILIDNDLEPHLMDFGLARRDVGEVTITADGQVLGTPAYMSPEQAQGEAHQADRRSDVYSLGVILFQLLTGERPFRGNPRMLVHQVIHDEPPSPRKLNTHVAKGLETITLKCLEKDPNKRYQTARDVADELRRYLDGEPIAARPIGIISKAWRWSKKRPAVAALGLLMLALAIGGPMVAVRQSRLLVERDSAFAQAHEERNKAVRAAASEKEARVKAEATTTFALDLLKMPGREKEGLNVLSVSTLMQVAVERVRERFHDEPAEAARFLRALSYTLSDLGFHQEAVEVVAEAVECSTAAYGPNAAETFACERSRAFLHWPSGEREESLKLLLALVPRVEQHLGKDHEEYLLLCTRIAELYGDDGSPEALKWARLVDPRYKELLSEDAPLQRQLTRRIARVYRMVSDPRAAQYFREAYRLEKTYDGPTAPSTLGTMILLPWGTREYQPDEALALTERAVQLFREKYGDNSPEMLWPLRALTVRCCVSEEYLLAYETEMERLRICRIHQENPISDNIGDYAWLTFDGLLQIGETERAMELGDGIIELLREIEGPTHNDVAVAIARQVEGLTKSPNQDISKPIIGRLLGQTLEQFETTKRVRGPTSEQTAFQAELLVKCASNVGQINASLTAFEALSRWGEEQLDPQRWQEIVSDSPKTAALVLRIVGALAKSYGDLSGDSRNRIGTIGFHNTAVDILQLLGEESNSITPDLRDDALAAAIPVSHVLDNQGERELAERLVGRAVSYAVASDRQQSVSNDTLNTLAEECVAAQRFDLATTVFRVAMERTPDEAQRWYGTAIAALASGDVQQYRDLCQGMLDRFSQSSEINTIERIGYVSVPVPGAVGRPEEIVEIAKRVAEAWKGGTYRLVGATLYRAGQYEEAWDAFRTAEGAGWDGVAWDHAFKAMILHRLGRDSEAREELTKARQLSSQYTSWYEKVEVEFLIREAESLITRQ